MLKACSCYQYLSIAETTRAELPIPTDWKDTSYNSLLIVVNRLTKIFKLAQKIDVPQLPQLNRPRLRVLVPLVPLLGSIAVTTYTSFARTLNKNLMAA